MEQIVCFFVSIFMFSSLFATSAEALAEKQKSRIIKQNINSAGRDILNYIKNEDSQTIIDEEAYLKSIESMSNTGKIIGGIFYYNNCISVIKKEMNKYVIKSVNTDQMSERNRLNTINNFLSFLCNEKERRFIINISVENEEDHLTEEFFNKLRPNTIFIIAETEKNVIISGFELNIL